MGKEPDGFESQRDALESAVRDLKQSASAQVVLQHLARRVDDLGWQLRRLDLAEYITLFRHPGRMLLFNFAAGLARGFGMAVGFTLLGALLVYVLQHLLVSHLPVIGKFIADLVRIVNAHLNAG